MQTEMIWKVEVKLNNNSVIVIDKLNKTALKELRQSIWVMGVKREIEPGKVYEWISPLRICEVIATVVA